jgi:PEP-CTERM motif
MEQTARVRYAEFMRLQRTPTILFLVVVLLAYSAPAFANTIFFNGFETDVSGWMTPTREASGTGGITAASGGFYALAKGDFTRYGGYTSVFPDGGFTTSLDIYLDVNAGVANDTRFDWDNAISNTSGAFLRDFVFNAGFYSATDATGSGNRFEISVSNNAGRSGANPEGANAFAITTTGWYTFQDTFYETGGVLKDDLTIRDTANTVLNTWTITDASDAIANVGGNRYGWFPNNEFAGGLAIDNSSLTESSVPEPGSLMLMGSGLLSLAGLVRRKAVR